MEDTLLLIPDEPMEACGTVVILTTDELREWLADMAGRALVLDANGQLWIVAEPDDAESAIATRFGVEACASDCHVDPHVRWTTHTYADALPKPLTVLAMAKANSRG